MNTKLIVGILASVFIVSMCVSISAAHNVGMSGVAEAGKPYISMISGGERPTGNVTTLEAVTIGFDGYEEGTAYAGRPYISAYPY